jgi:hypothetical protein
VGRDVSLASPSSQSVMVPSTQNTGSSALSAVRKRTGECATRSAVPRFGAFTAMINRKDDDADLQE